MFLKRYLSSASTFLSKTSTTSRLWNQRFQLESSRKSQLRSTADVNAPKSPLNSQLCLPLPFKTDQTLRDEYLRFDGGVRFEFVLEDLDAAAGNIAFSHMDAGFADSPPISLVTAAVDGINMRRRFPVDVDLELKGMVSWVGRSSMEITLEITESEKPEKVILESFFVMAARNEQTGKSATVNPLKIDGDAEAKWRFARGEVNKKRRSQESAESLKVVEPSGKEMSLIHKMMMSQRPSEEGFVCMEDTMLEHVTMTQPQDRNTRNKIFGGYLMRRAFELARSTAYLFCGPGSHPFFLGIDDIAFFSPVHIGSLIRFKSKVVYSPAPDDDKVPRAFQVLVTCEITDLSSGDVYTSNTFHMTFGVNYEGNNKQRLLSQVLPQTYREAMEYLDGKRRFEHSKNIAFISKSTLYDYY